MCMFRLVFSPQHEPCANPPKKKKRKKKKKKKISYNFLKYNSLRVGIMDPHKLAGMRP